MRIKVFSLRKLRKKASLISEDFFLNFLNVGEERVFRVKVINSFKRRCLGLVRLLLTPQKVIFILELRNPNGSDLGKRNHTPPCSSAELFFAEKNGVHRGKISVVDMLFLVFIGFLYPPPAWKVFLSGQKSSPKDFLLVVVVYAFFFSGDFASQIASDCNRNSKNHCDSEKNL